MQTEGWLENVAGAGGTEILSLFLMSSLHLHQQASTQDEMCGKHQIVLVLIDFRQSGSDLES